jgi:hypothetical protein
MSGAHGTGKSVTLEAIKRIIPLDNDPVIRVDDFKVSRTVLKALGLTLAEATATPESTKNYQLKVLDAAFRHCYLLKILDKQGDTTIHLVDRTVADIYAYTRLWSEKNGIDAEWLAGFKARCVDMLPTYDKIFLFPIGKFAFVDDGIRAKEDTQRSIAAYTEEFLKENFPSYHVVDAVSIDDRANQITKIIQNETNSKTAT